jgi:hypothetical protein
MYANGDTYEGEYRQGRMEGRGAYLLADGSVEVGRYKAGADFGEGVRWTPDRGKAFRLRNGKVVEEIGLDEGARIAGALGSSVPPPHNQQQKEAAAEGNGVGSAAGAAPLSNVALSSVAEAAEEGSAAEEAAAEGSAASSGMVELASQVEAVSVSSGVDARVDAITSSQLASAPAEQPAAIW